MLEVKRQLRDGELVLLFTGDLTESADLWTLVGTTSYKLCLNTRDLARINSVGLKAWIQFFQARKTEGAFLRYEECSHALAVHLSQILTKRAADAITSVMAPFQCSKCQHQFDVLCQTPDIAAIKPQLVGKNCPQCRAPAEFDEIVQSYFSFLAL
jgi:hypothetical protein